jgi:hypothetical protein
MAEETSQPPAVTTEFMLEAGGQAVSVDGNERRFEQYVTPPSGAYLSEALWQRYDLPMAPASACPCATLARPDRAPTSGSTGPE